MSPELEKGPAPSLLRQRGALGITLPSGLSYPVWRYGMCHSALKSTPRGQEAGNDAMETFLGCSTTPTKPRSALEDLSSMVPQSLPPFNPLFREPISSSPCSSGSITSVGRPFPSSGIQQASLQRPLFLSESGWPLEGAHRTQVPLGVCAPPRHPLATSAAWALNTEYLKDFSPTSLTQ